MVNYLIHNKYHLTILELIMLDIIFINFKYNKRHLLNFYNLLIHLLILDKILIINYIMINLLNKNDIIIIIIWIY